MEYRLLGGSGLKVSALAYGTATFGGTTGFFEAMGTTEVDEARRLIDICLEAGVNLFDTADGYAEGRSEARAASIGDQWSPRMEKLGPNPLCTPLMTEMPGRKCAYARTAWSKITRSYDAVWNVQKRSNAKTE